MSAKPETEAAHSERAPVVHATLAERVAAGKAERAQLPRTGHAELEPAANRDTVGLIVQEGEGRVPQLLPIRYERMLASAFSFYRGTASVMAADLAASPHSGLHVQLCGDAHLSNFGGFASPDRSLVFDLNDFDETLPGPFEWDVKRLAASFEVAGRHRGLAAAERRSHVLAGVAMYRNAMRDFAARTNLEVWYARLDETVLIAQLRAAVGRAGARLFEQSAEKARSKDSARALTRLTHIVDGEPRFLSQPPLLVPGSELAAAAGVDLEDLERAIRDLLRGYRRTLQEDRRRLLEQYRYVDLGHKVVGVGSVGTRCWIVLLLGKDESDPLVLQVKEASESVLEPHLGRSGFANHGQRVVEGQRLMQAASDIFLGWIRNSAAFEGGERDFYVRQLWDWKASIDIETTPPDRIGLYAAACGWTLARAHARSGDRVAIASYLGKGDAFDNAIADFATAYADLAEQDFRSLQQAAADGRIAVAAK